MVNKSGVINEKYNWKINMNEEIDEKGKQLRQAEVTGNSIQREKEEQQNK